MQRHRLPVSVTAFVYLPFLNRKPAESQLLKLHNQVFKETTWVLAKQSPLLLLANLFTNN